MNRAIISQRITSILGEVSRLTNALYAMNMADIQRYPENYEVLSMDAALRAEQIACRLRHLIYSTTNIRKTEYLTSAGVLLEIHVQCTDEIVEVTLPSLLPKRKQRQSGEYLLDPLYNALSRFAQEHPLPRFSHCVVCFSHIYCRELADRRIRDYDNLELKQFLDVVAPFVMVDDTGLLCDAYNTTELGDADCTCISIMDSSRFAIWLAEREKALKAISDF